MDGSLGASPRRSPMRSSRWRGRRDRSRSRPRPLPRSASSRELSAPATRPRLRRALRLAALAAALVLLWLVALWPPPGWYRGHFPNETAFMAMRRHQADGQARIRYQPVPLSQIAPAMREAVLVSEDHRFYVHGGIDYQAIREALGYRRDDFTWSDPRDRSELGRALGNAWSRRDKIRGASTITQQLAKNLYL